MRISAEAALDLLRFSPIDWPGKTVRLDPDSAQEQLQRAWSGRVSIAELYHVNSKLSRSKTPRLLAARTDGETLRRTVVGQTTDNPRSRSSPPDELGRIVARASTTLDDDAFFTVELRAIVGNVVFAFEPATTNWLEVDTLEPSTADAVGEALRPWPTVGQPIDNPIVLVVIARFGRGEALYGPRAYRRALIDAGRLSQAVLDAARQAGAAARLVTEFLDGDLDDAVRVDGVEEGSLAAIELGVAP
jgi:hypothetical protein